MNDAYRTMLHNAADEEAAYERYCQESAAEHEAIQAGLAMELRHCYLCYLEATGTADMSAKANQGPLRGIVRHSTSRTHPTHPEADVYDVAELTPCGHHLI